MSLRSFLLLPFIGGLLCLPPGTRAAIVFTDNFATSSLNGPSIPTGSATSYDIAASKNSLGCSIAAGDLKILLPATTSGFVEAQARFATTPVSLEVAGDFLELTATFTATANIISGSSGAGSFLCYGLFNSAGSAPLTGLADSGLSTTLASPNSTGGVQSWQGYVSRVGIATANSTIITRPAQSGADTSSQNQDLIGNNWGGGAFDTPTGVTLGTLPSTTSLTDLQPFTLTFRLTFTAANTYGIESKLYSGSGTNGPLVFAQSATATGANFLTSSFDGLVLGYRYSGTSAASTLDIRSLTVATSRPSGDPNNAVAGLYFQTQPTATVAGNNISPAVSVVATNAAGLPVTNTAIALSLLNGSGPFSGTLSQVTDASGIATFADINLTSAGSKQLRATAGGFSTDSASFSITNAPAATLVFTTQPSDALVATSITPPVVVQLRDAYSNNVASNATIILTLSSGAGTLSGNASLPTDATGKANFTNLSINIAGVKQLTAATTGLASVASGLFNITDASTPAFPGAMGAGAFTSGGRGGDVYYVTSLADANTAGTLRYGINNAPTGGRTILFKVSGNIALNSTLTVNKPNITVAGQSAPGDGICIQDESFNIAANNVIVRHLRTRLGTNNLAEADGMWINSGTNIIVDHVSASWSVDETLSTSRTVANLTVQNCFITESLKNSIHTKGEHGYGGIISSANDVTYSYHHNLYAHHSSRNPRVGSDSQAGTLRLDFRNNVIYDWGFYAGYSGGTNENTEINYVGNYLVAGPVTTQTKAFVGGADTTKIYQSSNLIDNNKNNLFDGTDTGWSMLGGTYTQMASPFDVPAMPTDAAGVALQRVIAQSGAMPWRRDAVDQRVVDTIRKHTGTTIDFVAGNPFAGDYITNNINGTNFIGVNPWPTLASETSPPDTDNDGMPDYWELANGLNPNLASDRNLTNVLTGYTKLEEYLNWLADAHALCARNGTVDVNLRTATGGATNLTYSVAGGENGTVALLGDGFTARFTAAANTNGPANFAFTATDPVAAISFGPVKYGILITTTNAPGSNTAPQLAAITNRTVIAGTTVNFNCSVTDTDTPPQTITFTLQNGPTGSTLGSSSGTFSWRPAIAQSQTTNAMSVVATDNGSPSLSATQSFTITVLHPAQPDLQSVSLDSGAIQFQVTGNAGPDYAIEVSTNLADWAQLALTNAPALPWTWTDPQAATLPLRFYRIKLAP